MQTDALPAVDGPEHEMAEASSKDSSAEILEQAIAMVDDDDAMLDDDDATGRAEGPAKAAEPCLHGSGMRGSICFGVLVHCVQGCQQTSGLMSYTAIRSLTIALM